MTLRTVARPQCERCKEEALSDVTPINEGSLQPRLPSSDEHRQNSRTEWQALISAHFQLPHPGYPEEAHAGHVYTIQLAGKWLVSGGADKTIRVWDLETRRLRGEPFIGHSQSVICLQFDPSEKEDIVLSGSSDCTIIVWRFSTGQPLKIIPAAHQESILDLRFNQTHLFTASKDKTVKIWSRHELTPLDQEYPRFQDGQNTSVPSYVLDCSSMEPSLLEARLANGSIQILQPYTLLATLHGHTAAINALDVHHNLLVSGGADQTIRVWNTTTGQCLRQLMGHQKGIACIQTNGKQVVSGGSDSTIRIHDLGTGTEVTSLTGHSNLVRTLQVDFEGVLGLVMDKPLTISQNFELGSSWNRIVTGSYDQSIVIWNRNAEGRWKVEHTLDLKAIDASFSRTGHAAASITTDDRESVGQQEQTPPILRVFKMKFDRGRLVCSSQDSRIYCWEFAASPAENFDQRTDGGSP